MSRLTDRRGIRPDLQVMHSIPGRIRLRARNLYGRSEHAEEIVRKLSVIRGLQKARASPTTGSIIMHYDHTALDSVAFFSEVAAALGLIAEGIDPSDVEAFFNLVGISPADVTRSLGQQHMLLSIATFALGLFVGRRLGG